MRNDAEKTNVMRLLDGRKIPYVARYYADTQETDGMLIAKRLGEAPERCFKTLVTVGKSGKNYVFMVPVCNELDLKKAAVAVNEKSIEMIKSKELLPLTGYIHGGCSPIGMKKPFITVINDTAASFDTIYFSAGKIGFQVELALSDLEKMIKFKLFNITV